MYTRRPCLCFLLCQGGPRSRIIEDSTRSIHNAGRDHEMSKMFLYTVSVYIPQKPPREL